MSTAPTTLRLVSYGGGVQSTALLVLAAEGRIDFPTFVFSNVGDDTERKATLRYIEQHAKPYAAAHGIDLVEVQRRRRDGTSETLMQRLERPGSRSIPIPVRMANGAPGNRQCTEDFKIKVIGKWAKDHGATPDNPATVAIGISLDEFHRANNRRPVPHEQVVYPLLDLNLRRSDCERIIRKAGLPVPPKSSCFFCPFHRPQFFRDLRRQEPDEFERACQLEDLLNQRRDELGKDHVYLTRFNKPLRQAIPDGVDILPFDEDETDGTCGSNHCHT